MFSNISLMALDRIECAGQTDPSGLGAIAVQGHLSCHKHGPGRAGRAGPSLDPAPPTRPRWDADLPAGRWFIIVSWLGCIGASLSFIRSVPRCRNADGSGRAWRCIRCYTDPTEAHVPRDVKPASARVSPTAPASARILTSQSTQAGTSARVLATCSSMADGNAMHCHAADGSKKGRRLSVRPTLS